MKNVALILLFVLGIVSVVQEVLAAGALAINGKQGAKYGWAIDYPTNKLAEEQALKKCGDGCDIVFSFNGGAAAYAADQTAGSTIFGWGRAASAEKAKQIALEETQKRGAKNPIIRVWGAESKKGKATSTSADSKVKVFVKLVMGIREPNDLYEADFVGWTYATKEELLQYGQKEYYVWNSDDVTGSKKDGKYLVTSEYGKIFGSDNVYSSIAERNPIMSRFVSNVVHKNSLYARHAVDKYSDDVAWAMTANYSIYKGSIIVIDGSWTYEQLVLSAEYYAQRHGGVETIHNGGRYAVVDAGEF
jgi:hypothetical protein